MVLTRNQCDLLISMFNASIQRARDSGIPIGVEYYEDIEIIKEKLYEEYRNCCDRKNQQEESQPRISSLDVSSKII